MPSPFLNKPRIVPDKCIFYLSGTKEVVKKYVGTPFRNESDVIIDNSGIGGRPCYKAISKDKAYLRFREKGSPILTDTFSISCWIKRSPPLNTGDSWEYIGFGMEPTEPYSKPNILQTPNPMNTGFNYSGSNGVDSSVWYDDWDTGGPYAVPIKTFVPDIDFSEWVFFTLCREGENIYLTINGKRITGLYGRTSWNDYDKIRARQARLNRVALFGVDDDYCMLGVLDEVIIHRDVALYKEDFDIVNCAHHEKPEKFFNIEDSVYLY